MYMITIPQLHALHYIFMVCLYVSAFPIITSGGPPAARRPTSCTAQEHSLKCCGTVGCVSSAKTCLCACVRTCVPTKKHFPFRSLHSPALCLLYIQSDAKLRNSLS